MIAAGLCGPLHAQDSPLTPQLEHVDRLRTSEQVGALDSELFGDEVGLYNGATGFAVTDIDLPGNATLPVQLRRRFKVESFKQVVPLGGFGNWDLDVPYLSGTFDGVYKWNTAENGSTSRCSALWYPRTTTPFEITDIWTGTSLHLPGEGDLDLLYLPPSGGTVPSDGASYLWSTSSLHRFSCTAATSNGYPGQGFIAVDTAGTRYTFDVGIERSAGTMRDVSGSLRARTRVYLMASRVEDRHGNWVAYQYSGDKLTGISSSDGRAIALTWSGDRIVKATAHGREWNYAYLSDPAAMGMRRFPMLSQVTLPDASQWSYQYELASSGAGGLNPRYESWDGSDADCTPPEFFANSFGLRATHPSGAQGHFEFTFMRQHRSGTPANACNRRGDGRYVLGIPDHFDLYALARKTLSGPGLPIQQWQYAYPHSGGRTTLPVPCMSCPGEKLTVVTEPDGSKREHTFGNRYLDNSGRLLGTTVKTAAGAVLRSDSSTYMTNAEAAAAPFPNTYGSSLSADDDTATRIRPVKLATVVQQDVTFSRTVNSFDAFARPASVTRSSTLPGSPSRTEQTSYHDNTAKWVLGQVAQVTCTAPTTALPAGCGASGTVMSAATYDGTWALPLTYSAYGKLRQTLTWDTTSAIAGGQRGTLKTVKDGNNNTTTVSSWKRGIPQSIQHPATPESPSGATQAVQVNDSGWITAVTDENGYTTNYTHDAMGRLASIAYPTGDSVAWNTTTQAFAQVASAEYGIPAGHWRQTVATGNGRKVTYFDALWRPLLVREYDTANEAGTQRFSRFAYDHRGQVTFAAYPSTAHTASTGTWTDYDALGRTTAVAQDSELGLLVTLSDYLTEFQTRITDPKGNQTTTGFLAWDQPANDLPVTIAHPASAWTHIIRDVFGKPTRIRRSNSSSPTGGSVAVDRNYAYDAYQQLCRGVEPETGATLLGYDGAGNVKWSAAGLPSGQACEANGTTPAVAARRVDRTYDARHRLKTLAFPDGRGNQSWTYTPDGLPATIGTNNSSGGTTVTHSYSYNRRRLPTQEGLVPDASQSWTLGYGYNANGHLTSHVYPAGLTASYTVNALGQATQVAAQDGGTVNVASNVTYFPNGALKGFTYGNGLVHTATQNTRGLPLRMTDCAVAGTCSSANRRLDLEYGYDGNGNVAGITDHTSGGRQTRAMSYDARDRLTQTTSSMFGTAGYGYDALDNLTTVSVGGPQARSQAYCYSSNRLSTVRTGSCSGSIVHSLAYDVQGNLASKGAQAFGFDYGNRLREVSGVATYLYDGHGLRVRGSASGAAPYLYSLYDRGGVLRWQRDEVAGQQVRHLYLGGRLLAEHRKPVGGSTVTIEYLHVDGLGSPIARTNSSKTTIQSSEHEPYGLMLNRGNDNRPGFTGHVMDAGTGLTYMQQRYMDPRLGVFLSVDPVTAYESRDWRQFNRYAYAFNNPYMFADPDGMNPVHNWLVNNGFLPPAGQNAHTPIDGASRGDAKVVGLMAGSAFVGGAAGAAVAVGAPAMVMAAAESASLQTGLAAQQVANATTGTIAAASEATSGAVIGATVRTMVAVESEVSMAVAYAGASTGTANAMGASAAAATPVAIAEFATGAITGAAGVNSPPSSIANQAGASLGSVVREELKDR
ncbi:wall associated protein [Pseudoxanthomonas koreensis]|nr:wall associated protein [Pseudoxanthomonas koreensis]